MGLEWRAKWATGLLIAVAVAPFASVMAIAKDATDAAPTARAEPGGAATPEALMARLKETGQTQDVRGVLSCIVPEERALFAFIMGMIPIELMISVIPSLAGAEGKSADAAELEKAYAALLEKYGITRVSPDDDLDMTDPVASARVLDQKLGDIDHAAFVLEAMAILDSLDSGASATDNPVDSYDAEVASIEVEGDRATVRFDNVEDQVQIVKRDDRWYLRLVPPGF